MIAYPFHTPQEWREFQAECQTIRRDMPRVMALLDDSLRQTTDAMLRNDGTAHYRDVGAFRDLKELAESIRNPPQPPAEDGDGMG